MSSSEKNPHPFNLPFILPSNRKTTGQIVLPPHETLHAKLDETDGMEAETSTLARTTTDVEEDNHNATTTDQVLLETISLIITILILCVVIAP
jgi:hypothetical protein